MNLPHTLGHEIEGEVVSIGSDVKDIKVGENVVAFPWIGCGKCATCDSGDEHLCNAPRQLGIQLAGGFSDYCLVPDEKYLLDYTGIKPGLAATYMCSGLTAFGALKKINHVSKDDHILILGLVEALELNLRGGDLASGGVAELDVMKLEEAIRRAKASAWPWKLEEEVVKATIVLGKWQSLRRVEDAIASRSKRNIKLAIEEAESIATQLQD